MSTSATPQTARLPYFDLDQSLPPFGLRMPTRMTLLPFGAGELALVSPVPITDGIAEQIARRGEVRYLIAPNLLHHLYLEAASRRYPRAKVLAPSRLREKIGGLNVHAQLEAGLPVDLAAAVEAVHIEGAPGVDEFVFFHRATRTLVVTELAFNIVRPKGLFTHLVLAVVGAHGKLAQSRAWRILVRDRSAAARSVARVLELDFETLVVAHGDVIETDARPRLAQALAWLRPRALPAPSPAPLVR